jgi:acyl-CoA hydrolase
VFKKAVKVNALLKIYGKVLEFGNTSVLLYIEVRKHNVRTGDQVLVTHTNIRFVRIDEDGTPIPINPLIKERYKERVTKYGRGLVSKKIIEKDKEKLV